MPGVLIRIRRWLRAGFDGSAADQPGSVYVARLVVVVILAGSGIAMLETEQSLWRDEEMAAAFLLLDRLLLAFFSIEYLLRFWTAGEVAAWRSWRGRLAAGPVLAPPRTLPELGLSPADPGRRDFHPALPAHRPGLHRSRVRPVGKEIV